MKSAPVVIAVCISLAGLMACAGGQENAATNHRAQRALIGKFKQELLACAGTPMSERNDGERTLMAYYKEASQLEESFGGTKSSYAMVHHGCRATVILQEDRVRDVRYQSMPSSYLDEGHCEEIFSGCIGAGPAPGTSK